MKSRVAQSLMWIKNAQPDALTRQTGVPRCPRQFITHLYCTVVHTAALSPAFGAANVQW
jgi:hypothetical protein